MLTKDYVNEVKTNGNGALAKAIEGLKNTSSLSYFLENLGFLPDDFDGSVLMPLISHESSNVRFWVVKNLGKLGDVKYIEPLSKIVNEDTDSMVRREAVSSLGRMRNAKNIPTLLGLLNDPDPKILAQAIRGLLVFKGYVVSDTFISSGTFHKQAA